MRILVDTNICLDILQNRPGLCSSSTDALVLASSKKYKMFVTTATVLDIMYITRKSFQNNNNQKITVQKFLSSCRMDILLSPELQSSHSRLF